LDKQFLVLAGESTLASTLSKGEKALSLNRLAAQASHLRGQAMPAAAPDEVSTASRCPYVCLQRLKGLSPRLELTLPDPLCLFPLQGLENVSVALTRSDLLDSVRTHTLQPVDKSFDTC
jgi:hypothetical protein